MLGTFTARISKGVTPALQRRAASGPAMPKKESKPGKGHKEVASPPNPTGPVSRDKAGAITVAIHAKPGSKQNAITGLKTQTWVEPCQSPAPNLKKIIAPSEVPRKKKIKDTQTSIEGGTLTGFYPCLSDVTLEAVGVAIAAPPTEGEANAELCRYLSKVLEVKKSEVVLDKGGKSRDKVVKISAAVTPEVVLEKLKEACEG